MNSVTIEALLALNRTFYDRFAGDFARTRRSSPPGFDRIVPYLLKAANVIDLGCGNGRLLMYLVGRAWQGAYIGLDSSEGLLVEARRAAETSSAAARFDQVDLMAPSWPVDDVKLMAGDAVVSLAVLHHIPGRVHRQRLVSHAADLLPPEGRLVLSTWQFMSSPRLRKRLLPWAAIGMREEDVDPGDYLMRWGEGDAGRRYVAAIGAEELLELAHTAGLSLVEVFTTDGLEGDLNLYGVFARSTAPG